MLEEVDQFHFKESDKSWFWGASSKIHRYFPNVLISDKYVIQYSKIFYIFKDKPLDKGIMDPE